ncbi:hypothetical protein [Stigmatella aurantiaca]|nr:hypothetical protein [Stigmatella aurantiaca]EAU66097.1 hypothetical protein STIAU_7275 [Stigmatella aurantiaca DW4/3-1]
MPREERTSSRRAPRRDRRAIHQAGCEESLQFRADVLDYLQHHKLMSSVKWVSDPGCLPLVTLLCQQKVLEQLRRAPQFEAGHSAPLELSA